MARTTTDAVQSIANELADMERRASKSVARARSLRADWKAISDNGDGPVLLTSKYHAELVALTTGHSAALLDLHHRMTEDAKQFGIDLPPVTAGDDDGEIGIFSGGGR